MGNSKPILEAPSFRLSEDRVETALQPRQGENTQFRRLWRDDAGDGLHLQAGRNGDLYYWVARCLRKLEQHHLGDAERMRKERLFSP